MFGGDLAWVISSWVGRNWKAVYEEARFGQGYSCFGEREVRRGLSCLHHDTLVDLWFLEAECSLSTLLYTIRNAKKLTRHINYGG